MSAAGDTVTVPPAYNASHPAATFDYGALTPDLADGARQAAARIRSRLTGGYLATGHDLLEVKGSLGHGKFGAWLTAEFGMTRRTAERYMAAARFETDNCDIVSHLLPITLHALAAPSTPGAARANCMERVKAGEILQPKDVTDAAFNARHEEREARKVEARLPKGKKARLAAIAEQDAAKLRADERDRKTQENSTSVVEIIVEALGDKCALVSRLLAGTSNYSVDRMLLEAIRSRKPSDEFGQPLSDDRCRGEDIRDVSRFYRDALHARDMLAASVTNMIGQRSWESYEIVPGCRNSSPSLGHLLTDRGAMSGKGLVVDESRLAELLGSFADGRKALDDFRQQLVVGTELDEPAGAGGAA